LDARYLKRKQRMIGGVYQSVLRAELAHRFGVGWEPVVNGQAEIAGTPSELLEVFSKRAGEVVAALESIPCLSNEHTRSLVVEQLRPAIAGSIRYFPQRRMHLISILRTCLDYRDGVRELLAAIAVQEQDGSLPLDRLIALFKGSAM